MAALHGICKRIIHMATSKQLAKQVHQVYFGGNWTEVNIKNTVSNITWETATKKIEGFNTILALTYHIHYFTKVQLKVLEEGILGGKDSESYDYPNIASQAEWGGFQSQIWEEAERYIALLSELPNTTLDQPFVNDKHGNYTENIFGLIEHIHYHLGQIIIINKMITQS